MGGRPTIEDVASGAGVSTATVSAVINHKSSVGDDTREKVLEVIEALDYRPRGRGKQLLQRQKRQSIGFIIKEAENPFYAEMSRGIRQYARDEQFAVYVASSEGNHPEEVDLVALMKSQGVKGLIITPALGNAKDLTYLYDLNGADYPMVLLEEVRGLQTDVISVDNVKMMEEVVNYLISEGHEDIIHLGGPAYSIHTQERIRGFRSAFSTSPLVFDETMVVTAGAHLRDGYRAAKEYYEEGPARRPSAITCYNDQVAIGVATYLSEQAIAIPEEVTIVGYDNIELLDYYPIPISSVQAPLQEIGTKAAELLVRRIRADESPPIERVIYDGELVIRE